MALNCLVDPSTKERLNAIREETGESQGEIVDRALKVLDGITPERETRPSRKTSRRDVAIQERAASDVTAKEMERKDIDYSDVESAPTVNVANLRGTTGAMSIGTQNAMEKWRASRKPLGKPKDQKK